MAESPELVAYLNGRLLSNREAVAKMRSGILRLTAASTTRNAPSTAGSSSSGPTSSAFTAVLSSPRSTPD